MVDKKEKTWEYDCNLTFYGHKIVRFTITDHFRMNHPELSLDLIVKLVKKLNNKEAELTDYSGSRKVFRWKTTYRGQSYRLIFWFKDNETNHLWIRNCYPVN
ncbi:MAG: hypothetical protein I3273_01050 [Candidatus Moeniiplasma glomeromycotorum]|nr:hypothetical protein [Candidatus Moeniiplasma glomeromycotorum]MCE8167291.1 hypothetical protein [Candidatus Moeniiplasma glomeromycotorum]MCE8168696.1 hypothetical protein [Candidatus Moeniiplasma glomeromycotorum]